MNRLILLTILITLTSAHAEEKATENANAVDPNSPPAAEDTDISKLADQYWRPSEDELGVIQDRRYDKSKRVEATLLYGFYQGGGYQDTKSRGVDLTYHWSNTWGTNISYLDIVNKDSEFLAAVQNQYGFTPNFNKEKRQISTALIWTPIYAKFALLGKKVSHFETYIGPGIGLTSTTENHLTAILHIGEKFFLTEHAILRLEWKISRYTDKIATSTGAFATSNGGPGYYRQRQTDHNLMFGIGWLF